MLERHRNEFSVRDHSRAAPTSVRLITQVGARPLAFDSFEEVVI